LLTCVKGKSEILSVKVSMGCPGEKEGQGYGFNTKGRQEGGKVVSNQSHFGYHHKWQESQQDARPDPESKIRPVSHLLPLG
jgi:hypothetical protein